MSRQIDFNPFNVFYPQSPLKWFFTQRCEYCICPLKFKSCVLWPKLNVIWLHSQNFEVSEKWTKNWADVRKEHFDTRKFFERINWTNKIPWNFGDLKFFRSPSFKFWGLFWLLDFRLIKVLWHWTQVGSRMKKCRPILVQGLRRDF